MLTDHVLYLLTLLHSKTFKLSFFGESWSNLLSLHYLCVKPRCPQWILSARTTACNIFKTVRDTPSTGLHLVCRRPVLGCCYITFFLLHYKSYQLTLSYTRIATSKIFPYTNVVHDLFLSLPSSLTLCVYMH